MALRGSRWVRIAVASVLCLALVGLGAAAMPVVKDWLKPKTTEEATPANREPIADLAETPDTIRLPRDVAGKLGVEIAVARKPTRGRSLKMPGSLALDPDLVHRARARFGGDVQIPKTRTAERTNSGETALRTVRVGDRVQKDELLAVVWSKELGEKKSELIDALSQLRLDLRVLKNNENAQQEGAIPLRSVEDARRKVEADRIAIERAERTLRVYRVTDKEMEELRKQAERLSERRVQTDPMKENPSKEEQEKESDWARVEVRAPFAGTILERNFSAGDIVDTTTDLFKIVNLDQLLVQANAYEESLPALLALKPEQLRWSIRLESDPGAPPIEGAIDEIRNVLDPTTQTVFVIGHVPNPQGRLRSNQFVTATVELPPPTGMVAIPPTALVEDGLQSIVFVQPDPEKPEFTMQRVIVGQRLSDVVFVRSRLTARDQELTPEEKRQGFLVSQPLTEGQRVVTSGAVELKAELEELQAKAKGAVAAGAD